MKKQKKKKFSKFLFKFTTLVIIFFTFGLSLNYLATTNNTNLSNIKLTKAISSPTITIIDDNNNVIDLKTFKTNTIKFNELNQNTIDAFITSEDRTFFSHKGIDYKRLAGALFSNIKSGKLKQGGSTISQQLIKNTHLSSEKTLSRKMKEFKLTKQLEKNYNKNEIFELYLNTIYFGNGCYGISNATNYYFSKNVSELTLAESAMLAGIISSPSYNEPINHFEKANSKKELILKNMQKLDKITQNEYKNAINQEIIIKKHTKNSDDQFFKSTLSEATKILNLNENQLINKDYKIYTNLNNHLNNFAQNIVNNPTFSPQNDDNTIPIVQTIIIDNNTNNVIAYVSNKNYNTENIRRQPGSLVKPILVYAPAFEYNKITPSSFVLDEEISFGSYTPKNSNNKYNGWTTIRNAITKSLNIPAIKTLSYVGIDKAINFASNLGIQFDEKDNHLAIALGGLTNGTTIKELADAYTAFPNDGMFTNSNFITKIVDNKNRIIYEKKNYKKQVMSEETAYMITDTLIDTVKNGTAKKLNLDNIQIASKTGTTNDNKEAWNACYTKDHTIVTFIGNYDHSMLKNINGSSYPTIINREILKELYKNKKPSEFNIPDGIIKANLESQDLENIKTNLSVDQKNSSLNEEIFTKSTLPEFNHDEKITIKFNIKNEQNKSPIIKINSKNVNKLTIFKEFNNKIAIFKEFTNPQSYIEFNDPETQKDNIYSYYITAENNSSTITTDKIKIKTF